MSRCNGHRDKFKVKKEDQSALSHHIFEKHLYITLVRTSEMGKFQIWGSETGRPSSVR